MMCGGFTQSHPADDLAKEVANEVRPKVEGAFNAHYTVYEPVSYQTQVVAGTNFSIKIKVDGDQYIHVKVFRPLPCNGTELELLSHSGNHTLADQL